MLGGGAIALAPDAALTAGLGVWTSYSVSSVIHNEFGAEGYEDSMSFFEGAGRLNPYWLIFKLTIGSPSQPK
jgi:hypothetical protein